MSDTPIADQVVADGQIVPGPRAAPAGTELAPLTPAELQSILGARVIPVREWALALVDAEQFEEDPSEDAAFGVVKAIMLANSSEAVFAAMDMRTGDDLIGKEPGARSNVLEIYGAFPMVSRFEEGASCFSIVRAKDLAEGVEFSFSTGARAVQAAVLAHMVQGWTPFKAVLTRRSRPTQKGFYPLNLDRGI